MLLLPISKVISPKWRSKTQNHSQFRGSSRRKDRFFDQKFKQIQTEPLYAQTNQEKKMKFMPYTNKQGLLLPNYVEDWIPENHLARVIDMVVDQLDISALKAVYDEDGRPAYHPRMMLKILFYPYATGLRSSRKIQKRLETDIAYIWLSGHQTPDFRTISEFRRKNYKILQALFTQIVVLCYQMGMVKLGHISLDGVRLKANASRKRTKELNELEEVIKLTKDKITHIFNQAEAIDQEEEKSYEKEQKDIPKELQDKQKFLKKLEEAKTTLQRLNIDKVNLTDPEATFQKTEYGLKPGYNGQCAIDEANQVIVAQDVVTKPEDTGQLKPMIEQVKDNLGTKPKELSTDGGYYSGENLQYLEKEQIDGYIPDTSNNQTKEPTNSNQSGHPFSKENFQYHKEEDTYTCPEGKTLKYTRTRIRKDKKYKRKRVFIYEGTQCLTCPSRSRCLGKGNTSGIRHIERDGYEEYRARMKLKMQSEEGKNTYLKRNYTAEPPFGHLKHNLGYRQFLLRGLKGVKVEFAFMCIAYNITKIWEFFKEQDVYNIGYCSF